MNPILLEKTHRSAYREIKRYIKQHKLSGLVTFDLLNFNGDNYNRYISVECRKGRLNVTTFTIQNVSALKESVSQHESMA